MYSFDAAQTITGDLDAVWAVWSDPDRFPEWDPREERCALSGPFAVGSTIDSKQKGNPGGVGTITGVDAPHRWTVESPLPGGKLVIGHELRPVGAGRVEVRKQYDVHGPLIPLFRLWYGPRVRRSLAGTFTALQAEAVRHATGSQRD